MKFLHCSDLHIGRKLHGYSMIDDQEHILGELCRIADEENVDAVLIAGDVYDSSTPPEEAFSLLGSFLTDLSEKRPVYIVAGNHDSVEKLAFAKGIFRKHRVYITGPYCGKAEHFTAEDGMGELNIYLLPYTKVSRVKRWCRETGGDPDAVDTPDAAFSLTLNNSGIDPSARNILVAHEFVVGKGIALSRAESELRGLDPVGGADCISSELLEPFDYVALGHIHRPQKAGRDTVLYCGSPLKYSASEIGDEKHAVIVDVAGKGEVTIRTIPLVPKRKMVCLKGTVEEILSHKDEYYDDYVIAEVTERADMLTERLGEFYRIVEIRRLFQGVQSDYGAIEASLEEMKKESPEETFRKFFRDVTGKELTPTQEKVLREAIESAGGERE